MDASETGICNTIPVCATGPVDYPCVLTALLFSLNILLLAYINFGKFLIQSLTRGLELRLSNSLGKLMSSYEF